MMHPRISLHQVAFMAESTGAFLDFCAEAGFAQATLVTPKLFAAGGMEAALAAVARRGAPRIATLNHVFACHPDLGADSGEAARNLSRAIAAARALGAGALYLLTGGRGRLDWEAAAARFAALLEEGREQARAAGIGLLVENANAFNADIHIAHTLADTILLADIADVGLCLDLHACWAEARLPVLFRQAAPRLGLVQVSDYVPGDRAAPCRAVPGDGAIPLEALIGDLLAAGYEGLFDLELVGPRIAGEGAEAAARRSGEALSAILTHLGA